MNNDLSVNNVNITTNVTIGGEIDITSNLTVKGDIELTNGNTSIERYTNATKSNISMDLSINETANAIRLINGTNDDTDTNTYIECNNTTGGTTFFKPTYFKDNIYIYIMKLIISIFLIIQDLQFTNQQQTPVML